MTASNGVASERARPGRGRRPLAAVRDDVEGAAGRLLLQDGYGRFTVEKVVQASGVSSATIYKHWPSKGTLALDGLLRAVGDDVAIHDSGDVRADLHDTVTAFVELVTRTPGGRVLAELVGAAQTDADLASRFAEHYFGPRRRQALTLLGRAKASGRIAADVDPELLVDLVWGPLYVRLLMPHLTGSLTPAFARGVVDLVLSSAGASASLPQPSGHAVHDDAEWWS